MTDGKKDLTGLMELPPAEPTADGALPAELTLDDAPQGTVDSFASLEEEMRNAPEPAPEEPSAGAPASDAAFQMPPSDEEPFPPIPEHPNELAGAGADLPAFEALPPAGDSAAGSGSFAMTGPAVPEPAAAAPPHPLEAIRRYAEKVPSPAPHVPAEFPFTLRITGRLQPDERARLSDLITRENLGIREVDLEPQFEAGRILIPRVSEYAVVLLVQAIRGAAVEIDLGPSDEAEGAWNDPYGASEASGPHRALPESREDPAESLPVTSDSQIPGLGTYVVIDAVTASASLSSNAVEAEDSREYQELLEALQRELKYKSYRRGANAVLCFQVTLTPLTLPSRYRLTVMGSAVRFPIPLPDH